MAETSLCAHHRDRRRNRFRGLLTGLTALAAIAAATPGLASVAPSGPVPANFSTGAREFYVPVASSGLINTAPVVIGSDIDQIIVAGTPASASTIFGDLTVNGAQFTAIFSVEGVGFLTFSETVGVQVGVTINGNAYGTPESFSIDIAGTCGSEADNVDINLCSQQKTFAGFTGSEAIVIPAGTPISAVAFHYDVIQSNQQCSALALNDLGSPVTSACIMGYTNVTDTLVTTSLPGDPRWNADLALPEPGSLDVMGFAAAALMLITTLSRRRLGFARRS